MLDSRDHPSLRIALDLLIHIAIARVPKLSKHEFSDAIVRLPDVPPAARAIGDIARRTHLQTQQSPYKGRLPANGRSHRMRPQSLRPQ